MAGSLRYSRPLEGEEEEEEEEEGTDVTATDATERPVVANATDDTTNDVTAADTTGLADDSGVSSHRRNEFDGAAAPGHSTFVEENDD